MRMNTRKAPTKGCPPGLTASSPPDSSSAPTSPPVGSQPAATVTVAPPSGGEPSKDQASSSAAYLARNVLATGAMSPSGPGVPQALTVTLKTAAGGSVLDVDAFGLLVALCLSAPSLFAGRGGTPPLPLGGALDGHVLRLVLALHLVQQLGSHFVEAVHEGMRPFLRCSAIFLHFLGSRPPPSALCVAGGDTWEALCEFLSVPADLSYVLAPSVLRQLAIGVYTLFLTTELTKRMLRDTFCAGCYLPPPYVDEYGETDSGLMRGNPLHLCPRRYEQLQQLWLSHGIPEQVAHALEQSTGLSSTNWALM
ncbi:hypothetical protein V5799_004692 [Amblyomma americanum]|uniref:E3 ubiquitin-protein ligase n=1 Tax=Amblyomma americanum TaxID=6943 RepID=A0AAQ4D5D8_AMBAM